MDEKAATRYLAHDSSGVIFLWSEDMSRRTDMFECDRNGKKIEQPTAPAAQPDPKPETPEHQEPPAPATEEEVHPDEAEKGKKSRKGK